MKQSDFIKKYGDCEVTEEMEKCIKKKGKWMPEIGQSYYLVGSNGIVSWSAWNGDTVDDYRRVFMRIFKTEAEAERYLEIMKACKEASFEPDWEDRTQIKHFLYYSHMRHRSEISHVTYTHGGDKFFFETSEIAQGLIDKFGDKDIAKYLFNIEIN